MEKKKSKSLRQIIFVLTIISLVFLSQKIQKSFISGVNESTKTWSAGGDGATWSDDDNWSPLNEPTQSDDVTIDAQDATVVCRETFKARTLTIGGKENSTLTSNDFVFGEISPGLPAEDAIKNRKDGKLILKGAGTITLQGQYKDSEKALVSEPSFMFWIK